ncbi:MAG: glucosamine-6-phosphate deaminase [Candidatus Fimenecus sp.]
MKLHILKNDDLIAETVAKIFINKVKENPKSVLGFATGATPIKTYKQIINLYNKEKISFKDITTFNLDEYCNLPKNDENSYYNFMHVQLFNHIDIAESNINFLNGNTENAMDECKSYQDKIAKAGGIDIQLLGIGRNGHIGFNEPDKIFLKDTHEVQLTQSTIEANSKYFIKNTMPTSALTMGIGDIMAAKKVILIATGKEKAEAIKQMTSNKISPLCPASILQFHQNAEIFCDEAAAEIL